MWISLNEYATQRSITVDAVRKQLRTYKDCKELKGHWKKEGKTYIDDVAIIFLQEHSYNKNLSNRTAEAEQREKEKTIEYINLAEKQNELEKAFFSLNERYEQLQEELRRKEEALHKSELEKAEKDNELNLIKLDQEHKNKEFADLKANYEEKENIIQQKNTEISAKSAEISTLNQQMEDLQAELEKEKNKTLFQRIFKRK